MPDRTCSIEGCVKPARTRGWCGAHYRRWSLHGDPLAGRTPDGEALRFVEYAVAAEATECIPWPYATNIHGYGVVRRDGRLIHAHRLALQLASGITPHRDMDAAHAPLICHNRICINPKHLRWATRSENLADKALDGTHRPK
jgi:hypothetical protein